MRRLIQATVLVSALTLPFLAHADTVSIVLDQSTLSGAPGSALSFTGTLSNTSSATVFLTGADFSIANSFLTTDASPLLLNGPASLDASQMTASIELFDIGIPDPFPSGPGSYSGFFDIFGGPTSTDQNLIGLAQFTVVVQPQMTGVPEPSTLCLALLVGCALLLSGLVKAKELIAKPSVMFSGKD